MRKRKLYLSELIKRYKETKKLQFNIFSNTIKHSWCLENKQECLDYLPYDDYWNLEVIKYEIDKATFTIWCK